MLLSSIVYISSADVIDGSDNNSNIDEAGSAFIIKINTTKKDIFTGYTDNKTFNLRPDSEDTVRWNKTDLNGTVSNPEEFIKNNSTVKELSAPAKCPVCDEELVNVIDTTEDYAEYVHKINGTIHHHNELLFIHE